MIITHIRNPVVENIKEMCREHKTRKEIHLNNVVLKNKALHIMSIHLDYKI